MPKVYLRALDRPLTATDITLQRFPLTPEMEAAWQGYVDELLRPILESVHAILEELEGTHG